MITLRAYFDDSGTHASSNAVVMGGLVGSVEQWDHFERQWAAKLVNPLPGKPPLKKFHLSHCKAGDGEFQTYSGAERDAVTHDFRQIIIDSNLIGTSAAIDVKAWNELVVHPYRDVLKDALSQCVNRCMDETFKIAGAHSQGREVAVVFDAGMWTPELYAIAVPWTYPMGNPRIVSIKSEAVEESMPLQGADIVATENYWHALEWLKVGDVATPRPHMQHFLGSAPTEGWITGRQEIIDLINRCSADQDSRNND